MILLCTASDDYIEKYKPCIISQQSYCNRNNYRYVLIQGSPESRNWKRTKITELSHLLNDTSEDICLIDGDCYIKDICPKIDKIVNNKKDIFYVNGRSGRLNSGFLYFKNNARTKKFVADLQEKLKQSVPKNKGYFVTIEGENGHIIWLKDEWETSGNNIFHEVDYRWNCSSPKLKESAYILHFTNALKKEIYKYNENLRSSSKS